MLFIFCAIVLSLTTAFNYEGPEGQWIWNVEPRSEEFLESKHEASQPTFHETHEVKFPVENFRAGRSTFTNENEVQFPVENSRTVNNGDPEVPGNILKPKEVDTKSKGSPNPNDGVFKISKTKPKVVVQNLDSKSAKTSRYVPVLPLANLMQADDYPEFDDFMMRPEAHISGEGIQILRGLKVAHRFQILKDEEVDPDNIILMANDYFDYMIPSTPKTPISLKKTNTLRTSSQPQRRRANPQNKFATKTKIPLSKPTGEQTPPKTEIASLSDILLGKVKSKTLRKKAESYLAGVADLEINKKRSIPKENPLFPTPYIILPEIPTLPLDGLQREGIKAPVILPQVGLSNLQQQGGLNLPATTAAVIPVSSLRSKLQLKTSPNFLPKTRSPLLAIPKIPGVASPHSPFKLLLPSTKGINPQISLPSLINILAGKNESSEVENSEFSSLLSSDILKNLFKNKRILKIRSNKSFQSNTGKTKNTESSVENLDNKIKIKEPVKKQKDSFIEQDTEKGSKAVGRNNTLIKEDTEPEQMISDAEAAHVTEIDEANLKGVRRIIETPHFRSQPNLGFPKEDNESKNPKKYDASLFIKAPVIRHLSKFHGKLFDLDSSESVREFSEIPAGPKGNKLPQHSELTSKVNIGFNRNSNYSVEDFWRTLSSVVALDELFEKEESPSESTVLDSLHISIAPLLKAYSLPPSSLRSGHYGSSEISMTRPYKSLSEILRKKNAGISKENLLGINEAFNRLKAEDKSQILKVLAEGRSSYPHYKWKWNR